MANRIEGSGWRNWLCCCCSDSSEAKGSQILQNEEGALDGHIDPPQSQRRSGSPIPTYQNYAAQVVEEPSPLK